MHGTLVHGAVKGTPHHAAWREAVVPMRTEPRRGEPMRGLFPAG